MKRTIAAVLALFTLCFATVGANENIKVYSADGKSTTIDGSQLGTYKKNGWFETFEETVRTLYSLDGRSIKVFAAEVPSYTQVGWYENYNDTIQTLYALDGRSTTVYKAQVPTYTQVGWYEKFEDTVETLYSPTGEQIRVYKAEVFTYVALGWFINREDTVSTIFNDAGEFVQVFNAQVAEYTALGWYLLPTRIDPSKPMIALTFDDGPSADYTPRILNTFEKYHSKATFFLVGSMVARNPLIIQREQYLGCELGSHTYTHPNLAKLTASQMSSEFTCASAEIAAACGSAPTLFRPPYGTYNATVSNLVGLPLVSWSVDPEDWNTRNTMSTYNHIISHAQDGDIVLMHDVYDATAQAVDMLVPALIKRGFQLVTVSELASYKGATMKNGKMYYKFR